MNRNGAFFESRGNNGTDAIIRKFAEKLANDARRPKNLVYAQGGKQRIEAALRSLHEIMEHESKMCGGDFEYCITVNLIDLFYRDVGITVRANMFTAVDDYYTMFQGVVASADNISMIPQVDDMVSISFVFSDIFVEMPHGGFKRR